MAKDTVFPDDKLGWKPHPDSRSVLEEFRHVTFDLEFSSAELLGSDGSAGSCAPMRLGTRLFRQILRSQVTTGGDR